MINRLRTCTALLVLGFVCFSHSVIANDVTIQQLDFLVGQWRGVGDGKWGTNAAERTYELIFGGVYIRGFGQSVYPKQEKNPDGEVHESLDMYSVDKTLNTLVFRQFDNEAFVTTYYLDPEASSGTTMVFVSQHLENVPSGWRARVIFEIKGENEFIEHFELDTNKGEFHRYVTTRFVRVLD